MQLLAGMISVSAVVCVATFRPLFYAVYQQKKQSEDRIPSHTANMLISAIIIAFESMGSLQRWRLRLLLKLFIMVMVPLAVAVGGAVVSVPFVACRSLAPPKK